MSFNPYIASRPSISNTPIPLGPNGYPSLRAEQAIKKAERAQAKAARAAEALAQQLDRNLKIEGTQYRADQ